MGKDNRRGRIELPNRVRIVEDENYSMYHIEVSRSQIQGARAAIVPGSPERAAEIASRLNEPRLLARHRGLEGWLGILDGHPVVVQSTGMGGPSTEIVMQELMMLGIEVFLRVGTTGSIQPEIPVGTVIVSEAAVRIDGTSDHYAPKEYPAAADIFLTADLIQAADALDVTYASGLTASSATFYAGQERYDSAVGYVPRHFQKSLEEWQRLNVLNYEMEAAAIFTIARAAGVAAGCVCGAIAHRTESEAVDRDMIAQTEDAAIRVALEGLKKYLNRKIQG